MAGLGFSLSGRPLACCLEIRWRSTRIVRSASVRGVMQGRLDLAAQKGCTAVEPDNVDAYSNASGFPLTGLITSDEIVRSDKSDPWTRPSFSSSSYGGSPIAAASSPPSSDSCSTNADRSAISAAPGMIVA